MLSSSLFKYQENCVVKIMNIAKGKVGENRRGVVVALKPGSGKTLISLVAARRLLRQRENQPILVVGEVSTMQDWEANCKNHFKPALKFAYLDSGKTACDLSWYTLKTYDVVACSYDMLCNFERRGDSSESCSDTTNGVSCVFTRKWAVAIFDEAHRARNDETNVHKTICSVDAMFKVVLTATPCNNSIDDLLSLFSVIKLQPQHESSSGWTADYVLHNIEEFKRIRNDYLIYDDDDKESDDHFGLTTIVVRSAFLNPVEEQRLREVQESTSSKLRFETFVKEKKVCDGMHVSDYTPTKIQMLLAYLEQVVVPRVEKANVFCAYKQSIVDIAEHCRRKFGRQLQVFTADGSMSVAARQDVRERYFECRTAAVLIVTCIFHQGVNLHCANHTIRYDYWWNPTVIDQSQGRCKRPEQRKTVFDVELLIANTIDDHVWQTAQNKRRLIKAVFDKNISNEELTEAVRVQNFDEHGEATVKRREGVELERMIRGTYKLYVDRNLDFSGVPATRPIKSMIRKHHEEEEDQQQRRTKHLPGHSSIVVEADQSIALKRRRTVQENRRVELTPLPALDKSDLILHSSTSSSSSSSSSSSTYKRSTFISMPSIPLLVASSKQKRGISEITN